jgi:hypothetical protein
MVTKCGQVTAGGRRDAPALRLGCGRRRANGGLAADRPAASGYRNVDYRRPRKVELALTERRRRCEDAKGGIEIWCDCAHPDCSLLEGNWDACIVGASHLYFECGDGLA